MTNQYGATPSEELPNGDPGSDPENTNSGETNDEEVGGTNLNEKAFKGLQRRLTAKDRELAELKASIQNLQSQNQSGGLTDEATLALIRPLIQKIAQDDPQFAQTWAAQYAAQAQARQNQHLQAQINETKTKQEREDEEAGIMADLRELAEDLGADPAASTVDYGDPSMTLRERMAAVRETAKVANRPAKPTPPKATVANGGAANPNPGQPPSPRPQAKVYDRAEYSKALADYRAKPNKANMAKVEEIKKALVSAAESTLPKSL